VYINTQHPSIFEKTIQSGFTKQRKQSLITGEKIVLEPTYLHKIIYKQGMQLKHGRYT